MKTYEIHQGLLYVDGEAVPVPPHTVRLALIMLKRDMKTEGEVDESVMRQIVRLARKKWLQGLTEEIARIHLTGPRSGIPEFLAEDWLRPDQTSSLEAAVSPARSASRNSRSEGIRAGPLRLRFSSSIPCRANIMPYAADLLPAGKRPYAG